MVYVGVLIGVWMVMEMAGGDDDCKVEEERAEVQQQAEDKQTEVKVDDFISLIHSNMI